MPACSFHQTFAKLISASPSAWATRGQLHTEVFSHVAPHSRRFLPIRSLGRRAGPGENLGQTFLRGVCVCTHACPHACTQGVCVCVCILSQWMATPPPTPKHPPPLPAEQSCTVSVLQVSLGVSWPLFITAVLCTGRPRGPSAITLRKWVKEMQIKPAQQRL